MALSVRQKSAFPFSCGTDICSSLIRVSHFFHSLRRPSFSLNELLELLFPGIELVLGTRVKSTDVRRKTLLTATGETISYKFLIIATGARVLKLFFQRFKHLLLHS